MFNMAAHLLFQLPKSSRSLLVCYSHQDIFYPWQVFTGQVLVGLRIEKSYAVIILSRHAIVGGGVRCVTIPVTTVYVKHKRTIYFQLNITKLRILTGKKHTS